MRMPRESSANCRRWWAAAPTPTPAAVVLVLLLIISSSSSPHVADGVRTTPLHRAGASGPVAGAAAVLDVDGEVVAVPAAAASARAGSRATARTEEEEDEGLLVAVEEDQQQQQQQWWLKQAAEERAATGSRLPDCAHACGPCSPCRRVIVSFRCALQASESCPIAYRCMCRGRFFRVPSL